MSTAFSLRIFVADGDPDGLRVVERSNWIGKALMFPRALLPRVKARRAGSDRRVLAAVAVNMSLTMLYWRVGKRFRDEVLGDARADYGAKIVATLSRQLAVEYRRGFEENPHR